MNSVKTTPIGQISLVLVSTREQDRAIAFYESLGAQILPEWELVRMTREEFSVLARA